MGAGYLLIGRINSARFVMYSLSRVFCTIQYIALSFVECLCGDQTLLLISKRLWLRLKQLKESSAKCGCRLAVTLPPPRFTLLISSLWNCCSNMAQTHTRWATTAKLHTNYHYDRDIERSQICSGSMEHTGGD